MKISVRKAIQQSMTLLNDDEKILIKLCAVLCADGVSLRSLCDLLDEDSQKFSEEIQNIIHVGLLHDLCFQIYAPMEIISHLNDMVIPVDKLNRIISQLVQKTTLLISSDLMKVKEYFLMADGVLTYVLTHLDDDINWNEYAKLVINTAQCYHVYGRIIPMINNIDEVKIMRSLQIAKEHTDNGLLLVALARMYIGGFHYEQAMPLLQKSLMYAEEKAETNFVFSLYHENYGNLPLSLYYAYCAWDASNNELLKCKAALMIAYLCALLGEKSSSKLWLGQANIDSVPKYSDLTVMANLTEALIVVNDVSQAETLLDKAELTLLQLNTDAAMLSRIYYVRSQVMENCGLSREASSFYYKYSNLLGQHYASNGAFLMFAASEVRRLTAIEANNSAKRIIIDVLDKVALSNDHSYLALSVQEEICLAYSEHHRATGCYELAQVYTDLGKELSNQITPTEGTLKVLSHIFEGNEGNVPSSVTGEDTLWEFNNEHIQNMMADKDVSSTQIREEIEELKERFPQHRLELEVMAASLLPGTEMIEACRCCVTKASANERYNIALICARVVQDYVFDAVSFYRIALESDGFSQLNKFQRISIMLETVISMEQAGLRGQAQYYWQQLEDVADGTPLIADVYQARANSEYNRENYSEALHYYDMFLKVYEPENSLIDERLMSVFSFLACSYNALHDYQHAYEASKQAIRFFPESELAFNIHYNFVYLCLALGKKSEARIGFETVRQLARTEEEKASLKHLFELLKMPKKQRQAYFQISEEQNEVY